MKSSVEITLQQVCANILMTDKRFQSVDGCLSLYNTLQYHLNNPALSELRLHCLKFIRGAYPMLLSRYGIEELEKLLGLEDHMILKKEYDESMYIKARYSSLKGTIVEPTKLAEDQQRTTSGHYRIEVLRQGAMWPADVDVSKREEYLSPEDFMAIFKMPIDEFRRLDKYKRIALKKTHLLF